MIPDMSNASLMVAINTSVLKKTMDTNEALMTELLQGLTTGTQVPTEAPEALESALLDIYA